MKIAVAGYIATDHLMHLPGASAGGAGQQEPAGAGVPINSVLDRQSKIGNALDLVDEHQPVTTNEPNRVLTSGRAGHGIVPSPHRLGDTCSPVGDQHNGVRETVLRATH